MRSPIILLSVNGKPGLFCSTCGRGAIVEKWEKGERSMCLPTCRQSEHGHARCPVCVHLPVILVRGPAAN